MLYKEYYMKNIRRIIFILIGICIFTYFLYFNKDYHKKNDRFERTTKGFLKSNTLGKKEKEKTEFEKLWCSSRNDWFFENKWDNLKLSYFYYLNEKFIFLFICIEWL